MCYSSTTYRPSFPQAVVPFQIASNPENHPDALSTSPDHGQHLGQFGMGFDKRQLYETDIRVPLLVRGPGVVANATSDAIASHVDLAPTFLDMMGAPTPR